MKNIQLGKYGEMLAERIVAENGYRIVETNFRCKTGEIDIIAQQGNCYHFVEVKTRMGDSYGYPAEAVTKQKQHRIIQAAKCYLHMKQIANVQVQFDVIEIEVNMLMNCF